MQRWMIVGYFRCEQNSFSPSGEAITCIHKTQPLPFVKIETVNTREEI